MITTDKEMARKVTDLMHDCGIPANLRGHRYVRTAVMLTIHDETAAEWGGITGLYAAVGELCGATPSATERGIRSALTTGWRNGDLATQEHLFGYTYSQETGVPSNSCFIATLADAIRMEVTV